MQTIAISVKKKGKLIKRYITPSKRHQTPRIRRGKKKKVEKSSRVVIITQGVPGLIWWVILSPVVLVVVRLKQGLQEGIGEELLRWESPKVQEMVSGERWWSNQMKIRQGSKVRVEESIVDLSRDRKNFLYV